MTHHFLGVHPNGGTLEGVSRYRTEAWTKNRSWSSARNRGHYMQVVQDNTRGGKASLPVPRML